MNRSSFAGLTKAGAAGLALAFVFLAGGADGGAGAGGNPTLDVALKRAEVFGNRAVAWYRRTPPVDRVTWGGLGACAVLGLMVLAERSLVVRRRRVTPGGFLKRFRERLQDGKLDRGKALDLCELNPSPVSRVALAAVRRWGRPVADLERAVALASRVETDRLKRNVGTLRRIAAMSPLLGLLGSLIAAGRALSVPGAAWGPSLGNSLIPLTSGVALAILALVAYDGLVGRVEKLSNEIDRLGAETVDAIAMSSVVETPAVHRPSEPRRGPHIPVRGSHPIRVEIPDSIVRNLDRDDDPFDD
ncbi:MotA/TolQ/ExbB proton channel family protein [Tundrisphaera lichenicola]|uniref:MotA/TolQ/ExbB proton channel family protein n=1 Tax=Tundrisphaera lichenicola TaxID=2029860 RepID=UPI003EB6992D